MAKVAVLIYIAVSLTAVIVLTVLLARKKHTSEGFKKCICSSGEGGREQECQDDDLVNNLYVTNKLTEYSPPLKNGPGWDRATPGDINFPSCQGCGWGDQSNGKWKFWDFTDFGS